MIKTWFANRPVHVKLNLITVIVVLAALVPVVGITLGSEYYALRQASVQESLVQSEIISNNVAAAMAFFDRNAAIEILHALKASPTVLQAQLILPDGSIFAEYRHSQSPPSSAPTLIAEHEKDYSEIGSTSIHVYRQVRLKEQRVGQLIVETSLSPLHERLRFYLLVNLLATLLGLTIAYPLSRRLKESITAPLADLMQLATNVARKQDYASRHTLDKRQDEIGHLSKAFDNMLAQIQERDLKLSQMAYYDNVTGLTNRHYFMERLEQAVSNTLRYGTLTCLMFIDLDDFKIVNDTHGHDVGDALLREVAAQLTSVLRDNDVLCRLGGDEFAIIIENVRNPTGLEALPRKIISTLSQPMTLHGHTIVVGASIGQSFCPDHGQDAMTLLKAADLAMYKAKEQGKNRYQLYQPGE